MKRIALLLVLLLAEGVWAWEFGWHVGVDKFPVLQLVQRGLDLNQELGIEFEGPQFGFVGGIEATRPWREFQLSVSLTRLNHGENSVYWCGKAGLLDVEYQGSGSFPAWLATVGLSYPLREQDGWKFDLHSGLSLVYTNCWIYREGFYEIAGEEFLTITQGAAKGWGLGSQSALSCSRKFGQWRFAVEAGYRLAHARARGSYFTTDKNEGSTTSQQRPLTLEVDYDGPYLELKFCYEP